MNWPLLAFWFLMMTTSHFKDDWTFLYHRHLPSSWWYWLFNFRSHCNASKPWWFLVVMTKPKEKTRISFDRLEACPKCESNWVDKLIPSESQWLFGDAKFFSRVIGISSFQQDRCIAWQCPDCSTCWDRDTNKIRPSFDLSRWKTLSSFSALFSRLFLYWLVTSQLLAKAKRVLWDITHLMAIAFLAANWPVLIFA